MEFSNLFIKSKIYLNDFNIGKKLFLDGKGNLPTGEYIVIDKRPNNNEDIVVTILQNKLIAYKPKFNYDFNVLIVKYIGE